jgi:hypothetical protein
LKKDSQVIKFLFQDFWDFHFYRAHKSQAKISSCTSSVISASITWCFSIANLSQWHIKWSTVSKSFKHTHTHIVSSIYTKVTELRNDQTLSSIQWKQIFCNLFDPQTLGSMEWVSLPMYAASCFLCHFVSKTDLENWPAEGVYQK